MAWRSPVRSGRVMMNAMTVRYAAGLQGCWQQMHAGASERSAGGTLRAFGIRRSRMDPMDHACETMFERIDRQRSVTLDNHPDLPICGRREALAVDIVGGHGRSARRVLRHLCGRHLAPTALLNKTIGDADGGVQLRSGMPRPCLPGRQSLAAREMQAGFAAKRAELATVGSEFGVGIGIDTGSSVASMAARTATSAIGPVVNTAARVASCSQAGQIPSARAVQRRRRRDSMAAGRRVRSERLSKRR